MIHKKIAIIGAGNMGQAIASNLLKKKFPPQNLYVSTPHPEKLHAFAESGCFIRSNNRTACQRVDSIILAVKPQQMNEVLADISRVVTEKQLVISIAAGITLMNLSAAFPPAQPIVRVMPLLTVKITQSFSCWLANDKTSAEQKEQVKQILSAFGKELEVDTEDKIDGFTALAGGPAFLFYLAEILEKAAVSFKFSPEEAAMIIQQLLYGSAVLLKQSNASPKTLRDQVTSKGGTTETAFQILEAEGVAGIFAKGLHNAYLRAQALRQ